MKKIELTVRERESFGSPEARRMRRSGRIPGVLYGSGVDNTPLSVEEKALRKALGGDTGGVIVTLTFEGKKKEHPAILKDYQIDPVSSSLLHVDFMEVRMDRPVEATVRVELIGTAAGVKEGGIMDHSLREVSIRCLPGDMPDHVECEVEVLEIGDAVRVSDIVAPAGVEILNDTETTVASVIPPTILKEEVPEEEELEGEEGLEEEGEEAAPEGEEKAAAAESEEQAGQEEEK
mgnify:CR=1 FL=1